MKKLINSLLILGFALTQLACSISAPERNNPADSKAGNYSGTSGAGGATTATFANALILNAGSDVRYLFTGTASTANYTVELRFRGFSSLTGIHLIALSDCGNATFAEIFIDGSNRISANYATAACAGNQLLTSTTLVSAGTNHHVALVVNGASGAKLYLNGVQEAAGASVASSCGSWSFVRLGANASGGAQLAGYIDDLRLSNSSRYLSAFSPGTNPLTNDGQTTIYMNFDTSAIGLPTNTTLTGLSVTTFGAPSTGASPFP